VPSNTPPPVNHDDKTPLKQRLLLWLVVGGLMVPVGRWLTDGTMPGDRLYLIVTMLLIGFLIAPIRGEDGDNVIERKFRVGRKDPNKP
jgi:hypothetical protein